MIIGFAALLLWGAAAPPQAQGDPQVGTTPNGTPVRRHTFSLSTTVTFESAIRPAMKRYQACLAERWGEGQGTSAEQLASADLARCAEVRGSAISEADALLKADKDWPTERRRQSIETTFAQIEAAHRELVANVVATGGTSARDRQPGALVTRTETTRIEGEATRALSVFQLCLALRDGFKVENPPFPPPANVRRGGDCDPYRLKAAAALDERLQAVGIGDTGRASFVERAIADVEARHAELVALSRTRRGRR